MIETTYLTAFQLWGFVGINQLKQHKMTVAQLTKDIEKMDKKLIFSSRLKAGIESELVLQVTTLRRLRATLEGLEVQRLELKERAKQRL